MSHLYFPLSTPQRRIWYSEAEQPGTALNNLAMRRRLPAGASFVEIEAAWNRLLERHDSLRLRLRTEPAEGDDFPVSQRVLEFTPEPVASYSFPDRESSRATVQELIERPFDLAGGALWRLVALQVGEEAPEALLVMHHIISDGWSLTMLGDHLARLLEGGKLPSVGSYRSFVEAEREYLVSEQAGLDQRFWREHLLDGPEPVELGPAGARGEAPFQLSIPLDDDLAKLSLAATRELSLTLFKQVLTALTVVIGRSSRVEQFGLGIASHNRSQRQFFSMGGMFVSTLPLLRRYAPEQTFAELARQSADELDALLKEHARYPFDVLVSTLRAEGQDVSHVTTLNLVGHPDFSEEIVAEATGGVGHGLAVHVNLGGQSKRGKLVLGVAGDGRTVSQAEAQTLVRQVVNVLRAGLQSPATPVARLPLVDPAEEQRLLDFNGVYQPYPDRSTIVEQWDQRVAESAQKEALVVGDQRLSYAELDGWSDAIAAALLAAGKGQDGPAHGASTAERDRPPLVGVCLSRGAAMVASLLGVLKSGAGYIPLDPEYPPDRLSFMIDDAGISQVLAEARFADLLPNVTVLDPSSGPRLAPPPDIPSRGTVSPDTVAYAIFTSGTTGKPKGVPIMHHQVLNLWKGLASRFGISEQSRALLFASMNFDASVVELFLPLLCGATVVMAQEQHRSDGAALLRLLESERVSWATIPPALLAIMPTTPLPDLQHLGVAGEASDPAVVANWSRHRTMYNAYGPTECTVAASIAPFGPDTSTSDIGPPTPNTHAYVLDGGLQMVPVGVPGELYLAGPSVSTGYLGRPELTAERFLSNPWASAQARNPRMYKTGDLVRWTQQGRLEFIGRVDFQVKIRGHRIECGEVSTALGGLPGVGGALVLPLPQGSTHRLVAYVVPADGLELSVAELRSGLGQRLPDYMVPSAFVFLDAFPRTPNGKIDRKALPAPAAASEAAADYLAPRDDLEGRLCALWSDLLGVERVGVRDDFFALGGDSLSMMKLAAACEAQGLGVTVALLRQAPTVEALTAALRALPSDGASPATLPPLLEVTEEGPFPLSLNALMMEHQEASMEAAGFHHAPMLTTWEIEGPLQEDAFRRAVHRFIADNDALRVRIVREGQGATLVPVSEGLQPDWEEVPAERAAEQARAWSALDGAAGPACQFRLWRLSDQRHQLVMKGTHQLIDAWASRLMISTLADSYRRLTSGDSEGAEAVPPTTLRSFTHWYHDLLDSGACDQARDYWREVAAAGSRTFPSPPAVGDPADPYRAVLYAAPFPLALRTAFEEVCQRHSATFFEGCMTAYLIALRRLAPSDRLVCGYVSALRDTAAAQTVIGSLTNRMFLGLGVGDSDGFAALLPRVREGLGLNDRHHLWPAWREFGEDGLGASGTFFHYVPRATEGPPRLGPETVLRPSGPPPLTYWPLGLVFQVVDHAETPALLGLGRAGFCDPAYLAQLAQAFSDVVSRIVNEKETHHARHIPA